MTDVLPIKKQSSTSALNMFDEYTMLNDMLYGRYFGFTEKEVKGLCDKQTKISFEEISDWYNGYINEDGDKIYNPRSVVKALQDESFVYVAEIIKNSRNMLKATISQDTEMLILI